MKVEMILIVLLSALHVATGVLLIDEDEAALAEYELEYQRSTAMMIYSGKQDMATFFKVNNRKDITTKSQDPVCSQTVRTMIEDYHLIDPNKAMKDLTIVGKLIQLAYGASKGFSCSTPILKVLSNYQSLVKNSFLTTSVFTVHSMKSLRYHSKAIYFANRYTETMDKKYATISLKFLSFSSKIAGKMAEESQKLVKESDALMKISENALYSANDDSVATVEEKEKLQELMKNVTSDRDMYEQKQKDLKNNDNLQRQEEEKLAGLLDVDIVGGIFVKISTRGRVDIVADKDCSNVQCHEHANCDISVTNSCKCNKGYSGDGRNCKKEIREYAVVCATGECAVGEGDCDRNYQCKDGLECGNDNCHWDKYKGRSGHSDCCKVPKEVIHCSNVQCHEHANCVISVTNSCKCNKGYSGDGRNCKKEIRKYEVVCKTGECAVGEGDCDYDFECKDGLECGNDNCHWDKYQGRSGHSDCCKDPKENIHIGQWGEWSEWSVCSKLCGGTQQRKRVCKNGKFGDNCDKGEPSIDTRDCNECDIGQWGEWSEWSVCSKVCGGTQQMKRVCKNGKFGDNCDKENARKRAKEIWLNRIQNQKDLMENNAKLAKKVSQLNSHTVTETTLTTAIGGLDLTILTMGRIRTIFADATLFWKGVERSAKQLQKMLDPEIFEMYIGEFDLYEEEVVKSGYSWLAFAKICLDSALSMKKASKGVDDIMKTIPSHEEVQKLVKKLTKELKEELAEEKKQNGKNLDRLKKGLNSTATLATTAAPVMLFDLFNIY